MSPLNTLNVTFDQINASFFYCSLKNLFKKNITDLKLLNSSANYIFPIIIIKKRFIN